MFKKLKDKLAEEVKSSPQRIQQFAQAAQAAVTSASSSISDITNNDLFSIGDNDSQQSRPTKTQPSPSNQQSRFQDVSLGHTGPESMDYSSGHEIVENQRQRRLSNSSFASDISFRLPSYETPSMYHLQSDMEVSASEAEERGFSAGAVSLDRVTKEQLYAAYRRTQERYTKYRTQYGDLARHYKLLERENAKARSVLVETQDKALRRISELREQCTLEQSAKAHLEKALRVEIEEKDMKIQSLNTKVQPLQSDTITNNVESESSNKIDNEDERDLINLSNNAEGKLANDESSMTEITTLNNKIEKMEQLLNKYKESLKTSKEKNSQVVTEMQILSNELESKNKEIDQLKAAAEQLIEAEQKIQELNNVNEDLQNKINGYDFTKTKEMSTLEMDLQKSKEKIAQLNGKIEVFSKREEEYAISLAENKLRIHKELESKEAEIKSLKDNLSATKKEMESLTVVVDDYKAKISTLEEERSKLTIEINEHNLAKSKITELESQLYELTKKFQSQEQLKTKADEEYKCLLLQLKQETAEKLAMIDRNVYLENRNAQLTEENVKKSSQMSTLENELQVLKTHKETPDLTDNEIKEMITELNMWKSKYDKLESEIQEEREELVKLQSEIEKLLTNHELLQTQNSEFRKSISELQTENAGLQEKAVHYNEIKRNCSKIINDVKELQQSISLTSMDTKVFKNSFNDISLTLKKQVADALSEYADREIESIKVKYDILKNDHALLQKKLEATTEQQINTSETNKSLCEEKDILKLTVQKLETEKDLLNENVTSLNKQYENALNELKLLKNEKHDLILIVEESENKSRHLEAAVELGKSHTQTAIEKLTSLESENRNLIEKINSLEDKNKISNDELEMSKIEHTAAMDELFIIKQENKEFKEEIEKSNSKIVDINELQEKVTLLTEENISLKNQVKNFTCNLNQLETEINDLRKSHAIIEIEKDHLSSIIEKIETKDTLLDTKDTQTDIETADSVDENEILSEKVTALEASENNDLDNINDTKVKIGVGVEEDASNARNIEFYEKYTSLKTDYDILKEENRRLQSDIEGHQTYLTKISKENSALNDKLRELIATSDHTSENGDLSNDVKEWKHEIQTGKVNIDDLLRENTLLIEENLELKDQLQTQNYIKPNEIKSVGNNENNNELFALRENYNHLMQENSKTEQKLIEIEQMNKSVNANMHHIQEKNEKLRLSNEKLERRLDEALVSLRHLHSLQENTELEYLRNILYEYLTGSGTHSITLAKVLAAIVKFDDIQTQLVIQKEKERQGFLRQLGLI